MNHKNWRQVSVFAAALAAIALAFTPASRSAQSDDEQADKVNNAAEQSVKAAKAFDAIMQAPDNAIPQDLLARAKAIAVFPQVIKAAFLVGGEGGRGVVSRRTENGWSDPVYFRAGGASVGFQWGASATDFVLLFMTDDSVAGLMKDKFELGAEAAVAGGPVGRNASAGTDATMHAEILSYSRSRGVFAGVNLKGVIVRPEDDLNRAVYGKRARSLLRDDSNPEAKPQADIPAFPEAISKYASKPDDQDDQSSDQQ